MNYGNNVQVISHPLVRGLLSSLRSVDTSNGQFRADLRTLSSMLVYEALRSMPTVEREVVTPIAVALGTALRDRPLFVPILRAGLGMLEAATALVPESDTGFVGLARDEVTHQPTVYMESLPTDLGQRPVVVLDPMLATGGSLLHCLEILFDRNADDVTVVSILAAPEGVQRVMEARPEVRLCVASIDDHLNDDAFIVPGLGDAGDRQFGKVH